MTPTEYEQLVEILGRQFAAIDGQFAAIHRQLGGIDRRFDGVDRQLGEIDGRFDGVDRRFAEVALRFDRVDQQFVEVRESSTDFRGTMLGHLDAIYGRLERLEQEYHAITQALRRIELALADDQGRREILERDVAELKQQVSGLQSRIAEIEQQLRA